MKLYGFLERELKLTADILLKTLIWFSTVYSIYMQLMDGVVSVIIINCFDWPRKTVIFYVRIINLLRGKNVSLNYQSWIRNRWKKLVEQEKCFSDFIVPYFKSFFTLILVYSNSGESKIGMLTLIFKIIYKFSIYR